MQKANEPSPRAALSRWKSRLVVTVVALLSVSSALFALAGYSALYQAWGRGNLAAALPYLPWARGTGLLAVICATAALAILFSSRRFPMEPKRRLLLSLLATLTIALFSEFRNQGKFHFGNRHHFFVPGEWLHDGLNSLAPSLGDFLYRIEYSHWNDFLIGPAIVSVIYVVLCGSIYGALKTSGTIGLDARTLDESARVDNKLQSARIVMYVGLLWFFVGAWAEKAGYIASPHSRDAIDLPFEFAGTTAGFWMARVLSGPFGQRSEKFSSTFFKDLVASGAVGLFYTLVVGPLTEGVGRAVGRSLYPVVPSSLEVGEYTALEQHMRPFQLLLLAGATWWVCNRLVMGEEARPLEGADEQPAARSKWYVAIVVAKGVGLVALCLSILATMFSLLAPQGLGTAVTLLGMGFGIGAALVLVVRGSRQRGLTTVLGANDSAPD